MKFLKKVSRKITIIISIFMIVIFIVNMKMLNDNFKKNIDFTFEYSYDEIISNLNSSIEVLKIITEKIASNKEIIEILNENIVFTDLDSSENKRIQSNINMFEGVLKNLTFVDTINIINIKGNYLFSKGLIYENFNAKTRPWWSDEILNQEKQIFISEIHEDYNTGKYVVSIVNTITSNEDIIGIAVLDVFIEDLIKKLNSEFYLGHLETYIQLTDGTYYGSNGIVEDNKDLESKYYIKNNSDELESQFNMVFKFDKSSIL